MPIATFRTTAHPNNERVDSDAGVVFGCQLVKNGKTARFMGGDGKPEEIDITPELIKSLAELAQGRSLNAHWTHDWRGDDKDPLAYKIGAWKNVRIGDDGNLIGDLHLMPSDYREAVLWLANNTPDGAMMSIVFSYERINDRHARPVEFYGADLVETGAGTSAFFSEVIPTKNKPMTKEELIVLFADPQVKEAAQAAFAEVKDDGAKAAADKAEKEKADKEAEEAALAAEKEAGVTDADKKPDDDTKPAALRAQLRIARATDRKIAAMAGDARVAAEAALTAKIGNRAPIADLKAGDKIESFEQAKVAAMASGKTEAEAIRFVAATKPELYNTRNGGVK